MLEPGRRERSSHSCSKGPGARALGRRSHIRLCRPSAAFSAVTGAVSSPVLGSCVNILSSVSPKEAANGHRWQQSHAQFSRRGGVRKLEDSNTIRRLLCDVLFILMTTL